MFPAGFTRSRWAIFLLCKYFKPATTSLAHVGSKSAKESKSSSTKWTKDFLQLQTGENRSKNTPSLLKIQGIGLCSCGLLYCSTVRLLSRNRISSQWTRHYCFWQPLFLVFPLYFARYTDPKYRNPTYFLFRKVSTQTLATLDPFLPFFSDLLGF